MDEIETFSTALQQYMPKLQVTNVADDLRNYAVDGLLPRVVVTPTAVEQVAQIVALSSQHNLSLLTRGGGSRMSVGGLPERIDVLLETAQLTRLLEYEAPDLTCQVEAGLTLAALQAQLATKGQWLALDPPDAQQATLGGLLASNACGPKRLRYGSARDIVIGLQVVQANGEVARSGGRVVKNVAGYDLNKLYIGSLGTLGVIVEANFKLQPLSQAERTLVLTYTNAADAMETVIAVLGSLMTPSAMELIDAGAASDMSDFFGINLPTNGYTLAINFEGSVTTIDRQIDEARLLARKHGVLMGDDLEGEAQTRFWEAVREHMQGSVTCKVAILVSQVAPYLEKVTHICRRHDLEAAIVAHAGNGILYIELRPSDATARLVEAISALRQYANEARGSLVVERCPVELKRQINIWGEPGSDFYLMQRLKNQFDPKGTFVKGRFVGGL
ncbi:MAG TPA: FAD-binding oxidoreductase [Ktedonobacteraceae bacterium]|nr:FAD-binding oxidoreductase [Ktedonobacteraceae bacterium]